MPCGRPPKPAPGLDPRDEIELLCLHRGAPAEHRPWAALSRLRLEAAGLIRAASAMAPDGREVPDGYAPTPAGLRHVAGMLADAVAEREGDAGGSDRDAPEGVVRGGVCIAPAAPGHDCEQGSEP